RRGVRNRRELLLQRLERRLLAVLLRLGQEEAGDEQPGDDKGRDEGDLGNRARRLPGALGLDGGKVDGARQSSIPRRTATAVDAAELWLPTPREDLTRSSGSATRTGMPIRRSSSGASPPHMDAPPVISTSRMPREPGCS